MKIIFDSDMESDVDDVAALVVLYGFANRGEAEILGTISSSLNSWSAQLMPLIIILISQIAEKFPQDAGLGENVPNTNMVYREILNSQPDNSMVIATAGYLTNLSKLSRIYPDKISPLPGEKLEEQKVIHLQE